MVNGTDAPTPSEAYQRFFRSPLSRQNGIISGQLPSPKSNGPRSTVSNFHTPLAFKNSIDSFTAVVGSSGGIRLGSPVYSKPRSHSAVPPVACVFIVIFPQCPLPLNSLMSMLESIDKAPHVTGTTLTRACSSRLSLPSPGWKTREFCQMPPGRPLECEYVPALAPVGAVFL